jgi:DNA-binding MarR family transcriptional regulator
MTEIAGDDGLRISDLAKRLAVHQTPISNLAKELVRKELIKKTR